MHCHNCTTPMTEIEREQSGLSDRIVYECPACGRQRLHLQPSAQRVAEPDRTYTTQTGNGVCRHSVWSA